MPPSLALFLTTAFVAFLFWKDAKTQPPVTRALWIPLLWVLIIGSRFVSEWLGFGGTEGTASGLADGSPIDRVVFLSLQCVGIVILLRRRVSWSTFLSANPWLTIFLLYAAISIVWSDFPFVALKRWIKILGHPIMVLVVLTEPHPREAVVRLMKRTAYVLVPFSILLIKYFPHLGRGFSEWTGEALNIGVTTNKNALGYVCLLLGFFFVWHLLTTLQTRTGIDRRNEVRLSAAFLCMIAWLLWKANSATSVAALAVGIIVVLFLGRRLVDKRYVAPAVIGGLVLFACAEVVLGVTEMVFRALGRDPTLTGRVDLWSDLMHVSINPLLGVGFESFWLGQRMEWLWNKYWWRPNQAHNGYIETYLNLGWVGLILLAGWIFAAFGKAGRTLVSDFHFGRFQIGLLAMVTVYNYTEATFKALHLVWFMFYLVAVEYRNVASRVHHPVAQRHTKRVRPTMALQADAPVVSQGRFAPRPSMRRPRATS